MRGIEGLCGQMNLTPIEARVLGSLIEKDITTPDYGRTAKGDCAYEAIATARAAQAINFKAIPICWFMEILLFA
jgi:hypothetical protein